MADPFGNSTSQYHLLFSLKTSQSGNIDVLSSISYIWEEDRIEKLKNYQWKCLWCNVKFQCINATKNLSHVNGTKCMNIKICTDSNGNLFSWSHFPANVRQLWIYLLHQISLPYNYVHHLSSDFLTWPTHLVTHPQSIILFSVGNHRTQEILRF